MFLLTRRVQKVSLKCISLIVFSKFRGILGGLNAPPGGVWGVGENVFLLKDALYLDNSNDTSFSSIGHRDGKLFNFLTFLDIFWTFWGVKRAPRGSLGGG